MSTNDVVNIKSAYEKMLQDGSAFEQIDMRMNEQPDMGGLGDVVTEKNNAPVTKHPSLEPEEGLQEDNTDFSDIDRRMSERLNSLRNKVKGGGGTPQQPQMGNPQKELLKLKIRIAKIEEALMLVMETHEKLL